MTAGDTAVIDTVVHPLMRRNDLLQEYMKEPLKRLFVSGAYRSLYPAPTGAPPFGEFLASARSRDADPLDLPGSDPRQTLAHLDANGVDQGVLVPLTRGLNASTNHNTAICAATNDWLADIWLEQRARHRRFYGSICVNPRDPEAAVAEIQRWAAHPAMVQVVVPMLVHLPYGQRVYHPIWAEAASHGLPVAVRADGGTGLEFPPTPVGYPRFFIEYNTFASANFGTHLASLITEGVFEKYPSLKFVFSDGGHDVLTQLIWRMDTTFPACRGETPWVKRMPSEYLADHVRFASAKHERPDLDAAGTADWARISQVEALLMFGSHYPHWTTMTADELFPTLAETTRRRMLAGNARDLYKDRTGSAVSTSAG
jgi:predicted TIM-barrel fold metal-dependent hydrolase